MLFAHDTETSLQSMAALVNTATTGDLETVADLNDFCHAWEFTGSRALDREELDQVRALRTRLRTLWDTSELGTVEFVNSLLTEYEALPQLVRHDHWSWHLHATRPSDPLAARMAVEAAMAMVDVIRAEELGRLRLCAADDCEAVLVDLSRNRSRRYCDLGCGNRVNVAAYRARQRNA
ncbi:CGNR zinc finger domain-containing protein [Propionibacteriaceae bacterium Y1700]|uniref:CGNR zinc finger domain-containing protein n=1 Tax=Microlunatus sp. Y1700 TaxID=3418487 RepID=UPI003DA77F7A